LCDFQITTTHNKFFPACCVFTRRFLATTSDNSYYSASVFKSSLIGGSLPTSFLALIVLLLTPLLGPSRKYRFQQYFYCCLRILYRENMFTEPLPRNGSIRYSINVWQKPAASIFVVEEAEDMFQITGRQSQNNVMLVPVAMVTYGSYSYCWKSRIIAFLCREVAGQVPFYIVNDISRRNYVSRRSWVLYHVGPHLFLDTGNRQRIGDLWSTCHTEIWFVLWSATCV
jgi:hypothetical protein